MRHAIDETERRRRIQERYNTEHGIVPQSIVKGISDAFGEFYSRDYHDQTVAEEPELEVADAELEKVVAGLEKEMLACAFSIIAIDDE